MRHRALFLILSILFLAACSKTPEPSQNSGNGNQSPSPSATSSDNSKDSPWQARIAGNNTLVVYFSHTGNTKFVADIIQKELNCDEFRIIPEDPYPDDYNACVERAKKEKSEQARPSIIGKIDNLSQYNTIYLGFPNWCTTIPMPVLTFLEQNDLAGKTIIPFCTHEGDKFGDAERHLSLICHNSILKPGFATRGSGVKSFKQDIIAWVNNQNTEAIAKEAPDNQDANEDDAQQVKDESQQEQSDSNIPAESQELSQDTPEPTSVPINN
ncbi:MAG: flavodoxin [bacterium]|nr:flavodoxin [bacterium]